MRGDTMIVQGFNYTSNIRKFLKIVLE